MSRFHFKKHITYDLALLAETQSVNPFSAAKDTPKWEEVCLNLKNSNLKIETTYKTCKGRVLQLLKEFNGGEQLSMKASGVDETEMNEIKVLLTSIAALESSKPKPLSVDKKISKDAVEDLRDRALQLIEDDGGDGAEVANPLLDDDLVSTQNALEGTKQTKRKKPKVDKGVPVLEYLKMKSEKENEARLEELKVRAVEAENKKFELQLQAKRQEAEINEKNNMSALLLKLLQERTSK